MKNWSRSDWIGAIGIGVAFLSFSVVLATPELRSFIGFDPSKDTLLSRVFHPSVASPTEDSDAIVKRVVSRFGEEIGRTPLHSAYNQSAISKSLKEGYSDLISEQLMNTWLSDFCSAPGRWGSSPWADHIEITEATKVKADEYFVNGYLVEVTTTEVMHGGYVCKTKVSITVKKINNNWVITDYWSHDSGIRSDGTISLCSCSNSACEVTAN